MKRISFETAKAVAHIYKEYTTQAYSSTGELVEPYYGDIYHHNMVVDITILKMIMAIVFMQLHIRQNFKNGS